MMILNSTPEFLPNEVVVAEELIDAYLTDSKESGYHISVAETNGKIEGYVCYGETPLTDGTWDIYWLAVDHNRQGEGIGKELMTGVERNIQELGGRLAIIETSSKPNYDKTRQFYISQGYSEIAIIPDFYAIGDSKVIMIKRLR